MVSIGWKCGIEQYPPAELLDYAVTAEEAGFDIVEASDHFHPWSEKGQASFCWTLLGAVAARTKRILLGTGVTCPTLRYHPAIIAQATATLDNLAPGRVFLGVGTGEALNEYPVMAYWPGYTERRERLQEAIELMRELWTGETVSFDGEYYQTRKAKLYTPPTQQIPIYVSAMVPGSAEFAGKYGDGLFTVGGKPIELYKEIIKNFEEGAREVGKDPAKLPKIIELNVQYTQDTDAAIQGQLQYWAGSYIPALFNQKIYTPAMSEENGQVVGADTIKQTNCISADPEEHAKFVKQYTDIGFDHVIVHSAGPDQKAFVNEYGRDVIPRLH